MNFDTKYLIRWGIPGWVFILITSPFLLEVFNDLVVNTFNTNSNIVAVSAVAILTLIGVPLGYIMNQIHHSLFWVIPKTGFESERYFKDEILLDNYFNAHKNGDELRKRYSYLLTRKHELGAVMVSCILSTLINIIVIFNIGDILIISWYGLYFLLTLFFLFLIVKSRNYSSKNVQRYFEYYLAEAKEKQNGNHNSFKSYWSSFL
ncbi:BA5345 family protein [Jeotgalibacillus aurantiacus]|uniref:hypothetical protein n=1 Tax=Jeotgalibacillus aurantiacus TaxID=2763266 RepID=UPI001D0A3ED6|nr:hypothetical protein [Jeotgalibacillus aurantiacus]